MKIKSFFILICLFYLQSALAQYNFPACSPAYVSGNIYTGGMQASYMGHNYQAKHWTNTAPGSGDWTKLGSCGEGGLGPNYAGPQRIIGYLPTWQDYDIKNKFNPAVVTNVVISFLMFKQNNNNYTSADFASIAFDAKSITDVDKVLTADNVLTKSHTANVKVSVALGGATDYAFLWLMTKYQNDDAKLNQIATLIANYVTTKGIDGIDFDLECWWADPAITGTVEQGSRVRGDKWGGPDQGPHPAAIGLRKLATKVRALLPSKLLSAAVFGTQHFGNNYDDTIHTSLDWIGLMTYDLTGSWADSSLGPHSSLLKIPLGKYPLQTDNNPIYSAQDALEFWLGLAAPAWNHDGGFQVPKAKLVIGVPLYGYDFSEKKPNGGNGYKFVPYKDIVTQYPNAATSYDPITPSQKNGRVTTGGVNIYYDTPVTVTEKINYTKNYGHQGVIVWELTQDAPYNGGSSLLKALDDAVGIVVPNLKINTIDESSSIAIYPSPVKEVITFDLSDTKTKVSKIEFYSLTGQTVDMITKFDDSNRISKNISHLNSGVYLYKITTDTGILSGKIIKE